MPDILHVPNVFASPAHCSLLPHRGDQFLDWIADAGALPSIECVDEEAKRAGACFIFCQFAQGAPSKEAAHIAPGSETEILAYDLDASGAPLEALAQVNCAVHTTFKHTVAKPRYRVFVKLSRPVASGPEFLRAYHAGARVLGLDYDKKTKNANRLFFVPQHRAGGGGGERHRFRGVDLDLDFLLSLELEGPSVPGEAPDGPGIALAPSQLKRLGKKWAVSYSPKVHANGVALLAVLEGKPYADGGSVHDVTLRLTQALAFEVGTGIDWEHLGRIFEPSWRLMWPDEDLGEMWGRWRTMGTGADDKAREAGAEGVDDELAGDALERAKASLVARALIVAHGSKYYVFDPRGDSYAGPTNGANLPSMCRAWLDGFDSFTWKLPANKGQTVLKTAPLLLEQYGSAVGSVHYWAGKVPKPYDAEAGALNVQCYRALTRVAKRHEIVAKWLESLAGPQTARVLGWIAKCPDLSQPLPALTFIGPAKTWKSTFCKAVGYMWPGGACDAGDVIGSRFNAELLRNPVIWSEEALASDDRGHIHAGRYRKSITALDHAIEAKGVDVVTLHGAVRHVISVNSRELVFSNELSAAAIDATLERFLIIETDEGRMADFYAAWSSHPDFGLLHQHDGAAIREHFAWIAEHEGQTASEGRLWVSTGTTEADFRAARFDNDRLQVLMAGALQIQDSLLRISVAQPDLFGRLPFIVAKSGAVHMSPQNLHDNWAGDAPARALRAWGRAMLPGQIGKHLTAAGLVQKDGGTKVRTPAGRIRAVELNGDTLKAFIEESAGRDFNAFKADVLKLQKLFDDKGLN